MIDKNSKYFVNKLTENNKRKDSLNFNTKKWSSSIEEDKGNSLSVDKVKATIFFLKKTQNIISELNHKDSLAQKENSMLCPTDLLIKELKKSQTSKYPTENRETINPYKEEVNCKNLHKIVFLIKSIPGFKDYMKYNNIDEDMFSLSATLMTHLHVKKGEYVFKQGDPSLYFYGIIKGLISIRSSINGEFENENKKKNIFRIGAEKFFNTSINYQEQNHDNNLQNELLSMKEGSCFGEVGLHAGLPRNFSALALEDTDLFVIDKHYFSMSFHKPIAKAEIERKNFILRKIPTFSEIHYSKFNNIFKTIIPKLYRKNEIVFIESNPADCFFLIYLGSCKILKNLIKMTSNNEILSDVKRMKFTTLLHIEKGKCIGLEAIFDKKYKYTLKVDSDFAVLFEIKISKIEEITIESLKRHYNEDYSNLIKDIKVLLDKKIDVINRTKIVYRQDRIEKSINRHKINPEDEVLFQKKVDNKLKKVLESKQILPYNNFKNFKKTIFTVSKSGIERNSEKFLRNSKSSHIGSGCSSGDNKNENEIEKLTKQFYVAKSQDQSFVNNKLSQEEEDPNKDNMKFVNSLDCILQEKSINNSHARNIKSKLILTTNDNYVQTSRESNGIIFKFDKTRPVTSLNSNNQTKEFIRDSSRVNTPFSHLEYDRSASRSRPISCLYVTDKDKNFFYKTTNFKNSEIITNRAKSFKHSRNRTSMKFNSEDELVVNKFMKENIVNWSKVLYQSNKFDSGKFNLPLFSVSVVNNN